MPESTKLQSTAFDSIGSTRTLAKRLIAIAAAPTDDPDRDNMRFEQVALQLARAVLADEGTK